MSKTNDTSYDVAATSERELTEAELELVTGGTLSRAVNFGGNEKLRRRIEHCGHRVGITTREGSQRLRTVWGAVTTQCPL